MATARKGSVLPIANGNDMKNSNDEPVLIIGGGICGLLAALMFERRGMRSIVYESREDPRIKPWQAGSAFTLGISYRSWVAFERYGILEDIRPHLLPFVGRAVHLPDGTIRRFHVPCSDQTKKLLFFLARELLVKLLLAACESRKIIDIRFNCKLVRIAQSGEITYTDAKGQTRSQMGRFVVGADGAHSKVRESMQFLNFCTIRKAYHEYGYKQINVTPTASGECKFDPSTMLHMYPRSDCLFMFLQNKDQSSCGCCFTTHATFESAKTDEEIIEFWKTRWPDLMTIIPDFLKQWKEAPVTPIAQIQCSQYHFKDKIIILGDAAHAVVPFFGQGANAAAEDVCVLEEFLDQFNGNVQMAFEKMSETRVSSNQALQDMSNSNFDAMKKMSMWPIIKLILEAKLAKVTPTWLFEPLPTIVLYSRTPYDVAEKRAKTQDRVLSALFTGLGIACLAALFKAVCARFPA